MDCKFDMKLDRSPVKSQDVIDMKFNELKDSRKNCPNGTNSGYYHLAHACAASDSKIGWHAIR